MLAAARSLDAGLLGSVGLAAVYLPPRSGLRRVGIWLDLVPPALALALAGAAAHRSLIGDCERRLPGAADRAARLPSALGSSDKPTG